MRGFRSGAFLNTYEQYSPEVRGIRTFAILFGDADEDSMSRITEATGGRVFDGRDEDLSFVFKQIRGYQ